MRSQNLAPGGMNSAIGIIAGSGALPVRLKDACLSRGQKVFVLGIENNTDMRPFADAPHASVRIGAVGEALAHLRGAGVDRVVMAGPIKRPKLTGIMPDATGAKLLARLTTKLFGGDDALLKTIVAFFEEEGFEVIGAEEVLGDLLTPQGTLGKVAPTAQDQADIALGIEAAKKLGARDAGQAVIAANGKILGEENEQGTAELIARCRGGVLVKMKKPGQERRADLPSIGSDTIGQAHAAGLSGIALEADASLILDRECTVAEADRLGLFIVGIKP